VTRKKVTDEDALGCLIGSYIEDFLAWGDRHSGNVETVKFFSNNKERRTPKVSAEKGRRGGIKRVMVWQIDLNLRRTDLKPEPTAGKS